MRYKIQADKNRYQAYTCYTYGKTLHNYSGVKLIPDKATEYVIQTMHFNKFKLQ